MAALLLAALLLAALLLAALLLVALLLAALLLAVARHRSSQSILQQQRTKQSETQTKTGRMWCGASDGQRVRAHVQIYGNFRPPPPPTPKTGRPPPSPRDTSSSYEFLQVHTPSTPSPSLKHAAIPIINSYIGRGGANNPKRHQKGLKKCRTGEIKLPMYLIWKFGLGL